MSRDRTVLYFLLVLACAAVPAAVAVINTDKLELHTTLNASHNAWGEWFFAWLTHLGDTPVPIALALFMLFRRDLRSFLLVGGGAGISALVVQLVKHFIFHDHPRPASYRAMLPDIAWVQGVDLQSQFSFPSGHSTAAFSTGLALAIIMGRPAWGYALALVACAVAYSRVYLSHHFTEDILAGALLGTMTTLLLYHLLYRSNLAERPWLARQFLRQRNQ